MTNSTNRNQPDSTELKHYLVLTRDVCSVSFMFTASSDWRDFEAYVSAGEYAALSGTQAIAKAQKWLLSEGCSKRYLDRMSFETVQITPSKSVSTTANSGDCSQLRPPQQSYYLVTTSGAWDGDFIFGKEVYSEFGSESFLGLYQEKSKDAAIAIAQKGLLDFGCSEEFFKEHLAETFCAYELALFQDDNFDYEKASKELTFLNQ